MIFRRFFPSEILKTFDFIVNKFRISTPEITLENKKNSIFDANKIVFLCSMFRWLFPMQDSEKKVSHNSNYTMTIEIKKEREKMQVKRKEKNTKYLIKTFIFFFHLIKKNLSRVLNKFFFRFQTVNLDICNEIWIFKMFAIFWFIFQLFEFFSSSGLNFDQWINEVFRTFFDCSICN